MSLPLLELGQTGDEHELCIALDWSFNSNGFMRTNDKPACGRVKFDSAHLPELGKIKALG